MRRASTPLASLLACAPLCALLVGGTSARAELAEFEILGTVESVFSNGDPAVPERLAELGVVPGAPLEVLLVYDTETPASSGTGDFRRYEGAVRYVRARIEGYESRGPLGPSPSQISLIVDRNGTSAFFLGALVEDAPDVLSTDKGFGFELSGDDSLFESLEIPSDLPDPVRARIHRGRIAGFDPVARRFVLGFSIDSIRRIGADGAPLRGGEPLLGLRLGPLGIHFDVASSGCTAKRDFVVDVVEGRLIELRLRRLEGDPCRGVLPFGTRIFFSYRELGIPPGRPFHVVNPLAIFERPAFRRR